MSIINISSVSVVKGTPATITLDKSAVAALPIVSGDAYFSNQANWYQVIVYYVTTEGEEKELLVFDASQASPTADFYVTTDARDVFDVRNLVIRDFNDGYLNITRDELIAEGVDVAADFDVDFGVVPPVTGYRYVKYTSNGYGFSGYGGGTDSFVSMASFLIEWDNVQHDISSLPVTQLWFNFYDPANFGFNKLIDGNTSTFATFSSLQNSPANDDFFSVDLGQAREIQSISIFPQSGYNYARMFTIYGSNDNINWTVLKVVDLSSFPNASAAGWVDSQYNEFVISPAPVVSIWDNLTYGSNLTKGASNSLTRSGAESWQNSEALSTTSLGSGDFIVLYTVSLGFQKSLIAGLKNSTSLAGVPYGAYTDTDYGFHIDGSTTYGIVANNPTAVNLGVSLSDGSHELKIEKSGTNLKYYVDGTLVHTVSSYSQANSYPIYGSYYNDSNLTSVLLA